MSSYQPFPISEFKTGVFNYLEPWIRPVDAFDPLENAFIYRGTLNKRTGYTLLGEEGDIPGKGRMFYKDFLEFGDGTTGPFTGVISNAPLIPGTLTITDGTETFTSDTTTPVGTLTGSLGGSGTITWATGDYSVSFFGAVATTIPIFGSYAFTLSRPIMGLKTWVNSLTDDIELLAFDTRRMCVFNEGTQIFDPINTVEDYVGKGTGGAGPYSFTLGFTNIVPGSFTLTDGTETFTSDTTEPIGTLTGSAGGTGTITWLTGAVSVTFNAGTSAQFQENYTLKSDYFTGTFQNFFNVTNWNAPGEYGGTDHEDCSYITNNVNRITLFDGTNLSRPIFPITDAHRTAATNDVTTCLDIDVFKNRLLLQRPSIVGKTFPEGPTIRFSAVLNPLNFVADVAGNGGVEEAPTSDWIFASEFLRDQLVVFFKNSTWLFKFTGLSNQPFRWDRLNISKSTECPYASVSYDERVTSVGSKGLIACDGVNVQRYDLPVIDFFLDDIDYDFIEQCYSVRFDNNNQTWTLYPDLHNDNGKSNKILVYNFIENTWCRYDIELSVLGLYQVTSDKTWADFPETSWQEADFKWNSYLLQSATPNLLGGSHEGNVYLMDFGETDYDHSTDTQIPYDCNITSTMWNPFAQNGAMVQFGYIDIYYQCEEDVTLTLTFYLNGSNLQGVQRTVELSQASQADPDQINNWQRVYINVSAQFLQVEVNSESEGNFKIIGMILWAKGDGRLVPSKSFI